MKDRCVEVSIACLKFLISFSLRSEDFQRRRHLCRADVGTTWTKKAVGVHQRLPERHIIECGRLHVLVETQKLQLYLHLFILTCPSAQMSYPSLPGPPPPCLADRTHLLAYPTLQERPGSDGLLVLERAHGKLGCSMQDFLLCSFIWRA